MKKDDEAYGSDEAKEITPDQSFIESVGHSLNGLELQPYTIERQWAADAVGLRYGRLSEAAARQFSEDNTYPGMAGDVAIVIWLCSLKDSDEIHSARRNPNESEKAATEFALKHKIHLKQKAFWPAYDVFLKIMNEVDAVYGEPAGGGAVAEKKTKVKSGRQGGRQS